MRGTFSTLCSGRVFATPKRDCQITGDDDFQYPVFGSSVCNTRLSPRVGLAESLSVPCVRVECLQPRGRGAYPDGPGSFSTLCSGRVFATPIAFWVTTSLSAFSTLCSGRVFATHTTLIIMAHLETFSTLCSGRVFATLCVGVCVGGHGTFSTLCSGRVFATSQEAACSGCSSLFQYPVFGSSVCNVVGLAWLGWKNYPFSTLCSGRVFATVGGERSVAEEDAFSTLCSGRVFATFPTGGRRLGGR